LNKILYIFLVLPVFGFCQDAISGRILEANTENEARGLAGANVYWLDTEAGTVTDLDGSFTLVYKPEYTKLVVSYIGFKTDTLTVNAPKTITHWLEPKGDLEAVTVKSRKQTTTPSYFKATNVIHVSSDELLKAACCNLSESFETNPSIDVNFADAISGTRQIKMLGLTSPYILMTTENIPSVRGAAQAYGLSFIPGTWVESIQITKGAGSVVNGFESIAGQINAELVKPATDDALFVNLYAATSERVELNTHVTLDFRPETDKLTATSWGSEIGSRRFEISAKFGYVNPEIPWQSLGVQTAFSNHKQNSYFGLNSYDIEHNSVYANAIYNSIISDSRHKIKTGISYTYDAYDEWVDTQALRSDFERTEGSVGAFFEYSFNNLELFTLTAGVRIDHHNLLGTFVTPRLHARYSPWSKSAWRASFGRGKRSANIFTENQQLFATSRAVNIINSGGAIYGLDPEIAWNYGVSYLQGFNLFGRKADITFDYYKTDFKNQVVVDWENPAEVSFYNLNGKSFANSFQAELNYDVFENFDLRLAYKYYDVKTDYNLGRLERPLNPKQRVFVNLGYEKPHDEDVFRYWTFDATFNWLSDQRFASTLANPVAYQLPDRTPTVATLNAQVTKVFSPKFEVYLGGENVTNLRQSNPILGADDPFGAHFDSTFVYGPIFGSMYYIGLRYKGL